MLVNLQDVHSRVRHFTADPLLPHPDCLRALASRVLRRPLKSDLTCAQEGLPASGLQHSQSGHFNPQAKEAGRAPLRALENLPLRRIQLRVLMPQELDQLGGFSSWRRYQCRHIDPLDEFLREDNPRQSSVTECDGRHCLSQPHL